MPSLHLTNVIAARMRPPPGDGHHRGARDTEEIKRPSR